ncbi:MAG: ATP-binding protein [Phycisphaerae bacterium]|nr:ATP-binding protein [Phycisphaerae bacterium]
MDTVHSARSVRPNQDRYDGPQGDATAGVAATAETAPGRQAGLSELCSRLRQRVGPERFERYFGNGRALRLEEGGLCVRVPSAFIARLLQERYAGDIAQATAADGRPGVAVRFEIDGGVAVERPGASAGVAGGAGAARPAARARRGVAAAVTSAPAALASLADFEVFDGNRLAFEGVLRLTGEGRPEGERATAMLIIGECGTGKTHLLQGAASALRSSRRGAAVRVLSGESFANEFIGALRSGRVEAFRKPVRSLDLLCIDDVHALETKPATQQELRHTIDAIRQRGGAVAASAPGPLRRYAGLREPLVSRLGAGLCAVLAAPDRASMARIAVRFAAARGWALEATAARELVEAGLEAGAPTTVREVQGLVVRVEAVHRLLGGGEPSVGLLGVQRARQEFARVSRGGAAAVRRPVRGQDVLRAACEALGVQAEEVMGNGRHARVVMARAVATALCRRLTTMSFPEIARTLGRPNHSTVITALQRLRGQIEAGVRISLGPGRGEPAVGELLETLAQRLASQAGA